MSTVEDRIVSMKFDNKQFEPAAKTTMSTLDRLKAALNFSGSNKGLNDLQSTANRFSLKGLADAAQGISGKFLAMSAVAAAALANITNRAIDAGIRIVKALAFKPIMQGFQEYETGLNSVQTILANTQASGVKLKDVNRVLKELNDYSDQTIYNFAEMARNIGTFTAAGVDLKTSASAIKGIANLAALSGSNSQQASAAMYQLSQAISAGRVSLQDWNSVQTAGLGGTVFQRALAQTAEKMGTLEKGTVKLTGKMKNVSIAGKSFRESITAKPGEESWLTSKVLTETLKQFTGDMTDAELASMGFTKTQIKNIQAQAKTAKDAATEVKTFTQLIGTLQETAGSGWAQTFQILLGDFGEAKKLWTEVSKVLGGYLDASSKARNNMLQDWKDLGGRTAALDSIRNIFAALVQVVTPIKEAFRQIFPAATGKQLYEMTLNFKRFTENLKMGEGTLNNLRRTFAGVFAILSIGWSIVKGVVGALASLFGIAISNSGGFLGITASIGDFLVKVDEALKKGNLIQKFFTTLTNVLEVPIKMIGVFADAIAGLFDEFDPAASGGISESLARFAARLAPLTKIADKVAAAWSGLIDIFKRIGQFLEPLMSSIGEAFSGIGDAIAKAFKAGDFNSVYDALNTGLLAGIVLLIHKFLSNGINIDFGGGFVKGITDTFGALTETLSAMQAQIQAKTLMSIAAAIALLTVSVVALSLIDSAKLSKALTAMSVAFGQLLAAMAILTKISGAAGFTRVPIIAASLILLSTAVLILTAAVRNLSSLSWEELSKGLLGVAALLIMLVGVSAGLNKAGGAMLRAGLAMVPLAIGIKILASAVKDFSSVSWGGMVKGLTGIAGSMFIISAAVKLMSKSMPKSMLVQAAGLLILSLALQGIGKALNSMGGMSWGEIAKGLVVLTASLVILAGALYLMSGTIVGAAALVVAAVALLVLVPALKAFASLKWGEIAKAMVTLTGSLVLLAAGLYLMSGTQVGSASLMSAAMALGVLAPVLIVLGAMSWESIGKGLVAIAGAFVVLGLSSLILMPLVPAIFALSVALLLLGTSMALIGAGALALATAFATFVAAGSAGIVVLTGMIALIPTFMTKFAEGIIAFATTIASQATKFTKAFASLLSSLLDAIILVTPKIGQALNVMIATGLNVLLRNAPKLADAGVRLLLAFLNAISKNIGQITRVVADLIVKFLAALSSQQAKVLQAGARFIIRFINELATTIRQNQSEMREAGARLASAILSGMTGGLSDGAWRVLNAAADVARRAVAAAKAALGINSPSKMFYELGVWSDEGLAKGFTSAANVVEKASSNVANVALGTIEKSLRSMSSAVSGNINLDPVITPVLDLTKLTHDATKIGSLFDSKVVRAGVSFDKASSIANDRMSLSAGSMDQTAPTSQTNIEFKQYNTSPKPLSSIEIYRNTKNQLSMAREAFGVK